MPIDLNESKDHLNNTKDLAIIALFRLVRRQHQQQVARTNVNKGKHEFYSKNKPKRTPIN